ncbi:MAG: Methionine-tRNA ligase [Parcubacteria group bacterium GW2011_GWF2_38_76]|nr:MAG: Methionine-tRNA ligase [Parcubacteria group bacterium GW2011_GWF2_38_76]HBM45869.1 methionine--tRNA ligase [Patescibacteria group bacterium]
MNRKTYITTTLPYVNAEPHIGFALEIIQADIYARFLRSRGDEVFFNFGTDEHGQKIYEKAKENNEDTQAYVDRYAAKFDALKKALNLTYNNFIRTTDPHHIMAAQEFWKKCETTGDIYKKNYKVKYCIGCELEKTDSELVDGRCPIHPNKELELREEENYFFKFSKYQNDLLELYRNVPDFVLPESRSHEIKKFVEGGLEDFSISRLKTKMPWGIEVPGDPDQVMYVWFDALINYISAIGWPDRVEEFNSWWPVIQFAGKDNLRQQSAMWQTMLKSAGLPYSKQIIIHGFITSGGQKMSKSLGNVINPFEMVEKYSTDALRYFLSREMTPFEDGDFTEARFKEAYNAGLANGLGNTSSRILKMAESYLQVPVDVGEATIPEEYSKFVEGLDLNKAMDLIWSKLTEMDQIIQETQPFKLIKINKESAIAIVTDLVKKLFVISKMLEPFMPETAVKIQEAIKANKLTTPLFMRKE